MKKSLPFRLYAGLALAIILVLLVAAFTINSLQKQDEETKWVNHTVKVIEEVRDIRYSLSQMHSARRTYWITGKENSLAVFYSGSAVIPNRLQELKKDVSDNAIQVVNINRLDSSLSSLFAFWENKARIDPGMSKEKFTAITNEEESMIRGVYTLFELIKAEEGKLLSVRENALAKYNTQTKQVIIAGIIVLILVVLLLVNAVIITLKSRIRAGNRLHNSLAEMEESHLEAAEKNWVLEGVITINNNIQSATGTNNLSQDIIESIVNYMQLPAGAIYLADEEQKLLTIAASVAVLSATNKSCEIGIGIVGNAALQKKITIIKDIPADYWKIESALGATSGRGQIACLPLWVGSNNLKAVIELGNLNEFTKQQLLLLEAVANNLATAINARQSRLKIKTLLEQVQEQQEAMTGQQEELRQTNEELSRQAEELQASEEELKTQEEELRQINGELQERNDTIEIARQTLLLKARELESTSKYKSEFLANMSHELRTPLNSVLILAKLLADNNLNNLQPKQVEYAKIIHKSGSDLLQLINDILDLSKIEAGKVELLVEEIPLDSIMSDITQLFTVLASDKEINFHATIADNIPKVIQTDKQRVEQVLKNLLSNAFKFTPKGGSVTLSFENRDQFDRKRIGISVTDSGIGISAEKQQLIFEAFQQADGSTSRQYGGTGLGLSISKELVRILGGEIEVKSEGGKGSVFTIILPHEIKIENRAEELMPTMVTTSLDNVTEQEKVEDDRKQIKEDDKVMLIIEDDESFASILKDFARNKGYKPIVALKGDEGLFYARKYNPDAIILDIQLPVIDGWSLLKLLKEDNRLKNIPVHIISAFDDNRLHTSGALAYVKKPIDREGLEKAFDTISMYLHEHIKKVLIISAAHFKDESLKQLFHERHHDVSFTQVATVENARQKLTAEKYDCLIADIGNNIADGINDLQLIQQELHNHAIPVIIYLDTDISPADELQLKKISNVIVRASPTVNSRLKDELELFLFKVAEINEHPNQKSYNIPINDTGLIGKKILLVDDDMRNVFALSNALEMQKLVVTAAADGKEALSILKKNPETDLVLMDIMMPEMDGYEAIKKIRGDLRMGNIPIIALTAKAMTGDREKCIAAGASDYITKPVDVQKLLSLIRVWLSR